MAEVKIVEPTEEEVELFGRREIQDEGVLSATKITTYMGCAMAYFLRYIEHVKVPAHVRFASGKGIHSMIERFYELNYESADSFAGAWKWDWMDTASGGKLKGKEKERTRIREYPTKKGVVLLGDHINFGQDTPGADPVGIYFGYMRMGENILKMFYEHHIDEKLRKNGRAPPEYNELGFGTSKKQPFILHGHRVKGFLDRVERINGVWRITDYKTDKNIPEPFTLHRNIQFTMYSDAFRKLFREIEEAIFFYHLRTGRIFPTYRNQRDQKDSDYLKSLMDTVAEGIRKQKREKPVPFYGFHCKFCDLRPACEEHNKEFRGGPSLNLEGRLKPVEGFDDWDATLPSDRADFLETQSEKD